MTRCVLAGLLLALVLVGTVSADGGGEYVLDSTSYCDQGAMANGEWVYSGAAASNLFPFGTRVLVLDGPLFGRVLVIADRVGWGSDLDYWAPSCGESIEYGRRTVRVRVLPDLPMVDIERHGARTVAVKAWMSIASARVRERE